MENLEQLIQKLRKHLLWFLILQGVGPVLLLWLTFISFGFVPFFLLYLVGGMGILLVTTSVLNRGRLLRREQVIVFPYYIGIGVKVLDAVVGITQDDFSGLGLSIAVLVWMYYIARWLKDYHRLLESN